VDLAIDQRKSPLCELLHECYEGHFGGICLSAEHGLAKKYLANGNAVQAAHEFSFRPTFHRMRESLFVQLLIGAFHVIDNPGARIVVLSARFAAGLNDVGKGLVEGDIENITSQGFS